jgi:hypothetical protein
MRNGGGQRVEDEEKRPAPATMWVITATTIQHATSRNFAELLRPIPA